MRTLIYNGKVYVDRGHFEQAVLISNGIIEKVGTDEELLSSSTEDCKKIDANGKTVLPGMNDSHQHLGMIGEFLNLADLSNACSINDIIECGRQYMRENKESVKLGMHGIGWNQDYFTDEKRIINRHDLDKISTDIPIIFERVCGHVVSANTKAMEIAGITEKTAQFDGGFFEIGEDGKPNGVFNENAANVILKIFPPYTSDEMKNMYMRAMDYAVSVGVTSVQSNDAREENAKKVFALLQKLYDEGNMILRYRHQFTFLTIDSFVEFLNTEYKNNKYDNNTLTLGPLKLFKDGSLGARTALMIKEYNDDLDNFGVSALSDDQMDNLCRLASENGIQVVTHVIGDAAIEHTLNSYEKIMSDQKNSLRNGLVHCQITNKFMLERIAKLNVLAMVQPIFLNYDLHVVESRVGSSLAGTSYAFNTLDKLGVHVSYGTDSPVESCNPFPNIYSAVTRRDLEGYPESGFYPEECVDVEQAIDNYTVGSSYAEFMEDVKGRIKPGYFADIIIIDRDIFSIPKDEIKNIKVEMTMVDGKIVYNQ